MKNQHLENLYNAMPEVFTSPLLCKDYTDFLCKKYNGQTEFEFDENDLDYIEVICRENLSEYVYDENNNEVINENEWYEFENYTINFVKNIIINNNK